MKDILIFADGTIAEAKSPLVGATLVQDVAMPDGSYWRREFKIDIACLPDEGNPERMKSHTMVGLERSFKQVYTAAEWRAKQEEFRAQSMKRVLGAIMGSDSGSTPDE